MSPAAPEDTQQATAYYVSSTAGSNVLTINAGIVAADVGKLIVVAGAGTPAAASAAVGASGLAFVVGDTIPLNISTCTTQPVLQVTATNASTPNAPGSITAAAPKVPGVCTSIPTGTQAQASASANVTFTGSVSGSTLTVTAVATGTLAIGQSVTDTTGNLSAGTKISAMGTGTGGAGTYVLSSSQTVASETMSGSGTGATFTLTAGANPLYGTIQAVSGQNVTVSNAAGTTLSNSVRVVAWGHDDAPALNALFASGATDIYLPRATYGACSTVSLPNNRRVHVRGGGAAIVALCPMTQVFSQVQVAAFYASEGSVVEDLTIDGMGLASYDLEHTSFGWQYLGILYKNATVANILCDGKCENSHFEHSNIRNDTTVNAAAPARAIDVEFTDNHFTDIIISGAINPWFDNSSGTYANSLHAYGMSGVAFTLGSISFNTMLYADSIPSGVAGFRIPGTYTNLHGWYAYAQGGSGQIGVEIVQSGHSAVTGGSGQGVSSANMVLYDPGYNASSNNTVFDNQGTAYFSLGNSTSLCLAYTGSCGAEAVAIGAFASAAFGSIALGHASATQASGSFARGYGANDNGWTQDVYSPNSNFGIGKNQAGTVVLDASVTTTAATRLTANAGAASASNQAGPNLNGSMKLQCDMVVHSTTSADVAFFQMSTPAILVRGASGAPTLVSGSGGWTAVAATSGAGTISSGANSILTPATSVDGSFSRAAISLTASSGSWHAQANCQAAEDD